jgi:hypothetical protein
VRTVGPHEVGFALSDMRCPRCGGDDMTVRKIWVNFPQDAIIIALTTRPLGFYDRDGGDHVDAWITLIVYCAGCDEEMDLYLHDGAILRDGDDPDNARGIWGNLD